MYRKLQRKLTIICAVSTGIVLIVLSTLLLYFSTSQLKRAQTDSFRKNVDSILLYMTDTQVLDHAWLRQTEQNNDLTISLRSGENRLIYGAQDSVRNELIGDAFLFAMDHKGFSADMNAVSLKPQTTYFSLTKEGVEHDVSISKMNAGNRPLQIIIIKNLQSNQQQIFRLLIIFASLLLLALLIIILFAWTFTGKAVKPIKENQQKQAEFISAASHEIRSPLTVMLASATAMKNAPPDTVRRFATNIEQECHRLSRLTNDLLLLASDRSGQLSVTLEKNQPDTLLLSSYERFEELAKQKNITLTLQLPHGKTPTINCDSARIEQLLGILIENAISYTPAEGQIDLTLTFPHRRVAFHVSDSGIGIPDSKKKEIFTPFFRVDGSHTDKTHYGLGLAIAQDISTLHKGTLRAEDSILGGVTFIFTIPCN